MTHASSCSRARAGFALTALLLVASGCGGGGGGGSSLSRTDILLADTPADDLLAFNATIDDLRLDLAGGGSTANLLSGPIAVEVLGLAQNPAWLASLAPPAGTYVALRIGFVHDSYDARRNDGSSVAVQSSSDVLVAPFATPLVIGPSGYRRLVADLDLAASLTGLVTAPPLQFAPTGTSIDDHGVHGIEIDEIQGIVSSIGSGRFVVDAFADDDLSVALGPVAVTVSGTTTLVDHDGTLFPSAAAFFSALVTGATLLEVHGNLGNGTIAATRVEVEDHLGGGGSQNVVKMRGLVLATGPRSTIGIAIAEVSDGASIVAAAFGGTIPGTLTVAYDGSTVFFMGEHQSTTSAALAIGQEVQVRFAQFANAPYLAARVEIEGADVHFEGSITSIAGLPASFVMHMHHDDPTILSGQVASTSTDVTVQIGSSPIVLDTHGDPTLTTSALLVGMKIEPEGSISGAPGSPTIDATKVKVRAGRLEDAMVTGVSGATSSFTTSGGDIVDPFGGGVTPGPLTIEIAPGAIFTDDAVSAPAFFALYQGLGVGEALSLEVKGIGTGAPDRVRAYEIRVRVVN